MKTLPDVSETPVEPGFWTSSRRAGLWRALPRVCLTGLAALLAMSPTGLAAGVAAEVAAGVPAGVAAASAGKGTRGCQKMVFRGEVATGKEWRVEIGEGWVFRVRPISGGGTGGAAGLGFTGWDLVMDRENGTGYPDSLLLATPPYGSVNEREIGTTFGMRAQDAIAWEPRKFHFFTSEDRVVRARGLFGQMEQGVRSSGPQKDAASEAKAQQVASASHELMKLISSDPEMGYGRFSITDARLVSGIGDPPAFARGWASHLSQVPHTLEQASPLGAGRAVAGIGAVSHDLGQLRWIQFSATLWLPRAWKAPPGVKPETANCAE